MLLDSRMLRGARRRAVAAAVVIVAALAALGVGGAVACRATDLNCHLRPQPDVWQLDAVQGQRGGTTSLDRSLEMTLVADGLDFPSDFDFLAPGRILVASRTGLVQLVETESADPTTVLDLRGRVSTWGLRGLTALVVDRRGSSPTGFYVAYSAVDPDSGDPDAHVPTTARVSRFALHGASASSSSEDVLVGRVLGGSCSDRPVDCLPADRGHVGADVLQLPDGTLLVATGDGGPTNGNVMRTQSVDWLGGKILRVDRDGRGLSDNPFWNGDPDANRSKVWAYGFRNPFRLSTLPDGEVVVGDVGLDDMEELDVLRRGADFGWPCYEGSRRTPALARTRFCAAYYRDHGDRAREPWLALPHDAWGTVVAGVPLSGATALPAHMRSMYVFADWVASKVWAVGTATARGTPAPLSSLHVVETGAGGPVRLRVGPDGALYLLSLNTGELWRIAAKSG
jgi:glucose/arabinose dehydrogenase